MILVLPELGWVEEIPLGQTVLRAGRPPRPPLARYAGGANGRTKTFSGLHPVRFDDLALAQLRIRQYAGGRRRRQLR